MFKAYGHDEGQEYSRLAGWNQVVKSSGGKIIPEGLKSKPEETALFGMYWGMFIGLMRGSDKGGILEIEAYTRLMGIDLEPWEVNLLLEMEHGRRNSQIKS